MPNKLEKMVSALLVVFSAFLQGVRPARDASLSRQQEGLVKGMDQLICDASRPR